MNVSDKTGTAPTQEEISKEAYYMWEHEGRPVGRDFEFWLRAELELRRRKAETVVSPAWALPKSRSAAVKAPRVATTASAGNGKSAPKAAASKALPKAAAAKKPRKSA